MATGSSAESQPSHWRAQVQDAVVALALLAALALVYFSDAPRPIEIAAPVDPAEPVDAPPEPVLPPPPPPPPPVPPEPEPIPVDPEPRLVVKHSKAQQFGVQTTSGNPEVEFDNDKKLMFAPDGGTNLTLIRIDDAVPAFGGSAGEFTKQEVGAERSEAVWKSGDVVVTQLVELLVNDVTHRRDVVQVTYTVQNTGAVPHTIALRPMLDTYIGNNDGVPFLVPGKEGIVTAPAVYSGDAVPDFISALERPDLTDPGVIVNIGLRLKQYERPEEVILTHWPGPQAHHWSYDRTKAFDNDSAVGLYYAAKPLDPGSSRTIAFQYGLGAISSTKTKNATLSLKIDGAPAAGQSIWVSALVHHPQPGQTVALNLPQGMSLGQGHPATRPVPSEGEVTQVSWLVQIADAAAGAATLDVTLDPEKIQERATLQIQPRDTALALTAHGPVLDGQYFWVVARVRHSQAGQHVELALPAGLTLPTGLAAAPDNAARQAVPAGAGFVQVRWLVQSQLKNLAAETREVTARLTPGDQSEKAAVTIQPNRSLLK